MKILVVLVGILSANISLAMKKAEVFELSLSGVRYSQAQGEIILEEEKGKITVEVSDLDFQLKETLSIYKSEIGRCGEKVFYAKSADSNTGLNIKLIDYSEIHCRYRPISTVYVEGSITQRSRAYDKFVSKSVEILAGQFE